MIKIIKKEEKKSPLFKYDNSSNKYNHNFGDILIKLYILKQLFVLTF